MIATAVSPEFYGLTLRRHRRGLHDRQPHPLCEHCVFPLGDHQYGRRRIAAFDSDPVAWRRMARRLLARRRKRSELEDRHTYGGHGGPRFVAGCPTCENEIGFAVSGLLHALYPQPARWR